MHSSMLSAANTMGQLQQQIDGISNNLSNSQTTGYKRRESTFSSLLHQEVNNQPIPENNVGRLTPPGLRVGTGAGISQTALRLEQGSLQETGRELDFALLGKNLFFQIENSAENEVHYSRNGSFYLSENPEQPGTWTLVNQDGHYLLDANGERMDVPAGARNFNLQDDGTIIASLNGAEVEIGTIELAHVSKPQLLEAAGNHFRLPDVEALGFDEADVLELVMGEEHTIKQHALEQSNVDMGKELTELLNTQRHYSFNARALSQGDQMLGLVNSIRS
ncbi:flagellar hook-basal body protein [Alteribacillus iranensis]|uniref:Flagellar basal-body rod protein FlgG n=1 Tax=Alteribacillus iranensis TaxID=930128 RepID=A0A1I2BY45_9BACI|nr:flagellar hook-basal body protein [Alteribacillus iranensis]SFE60885.1 flagellar basal-body rod protein FlgG [Alteribacillus iranensis]